MSVTASFTRNSIAYNQAGESIRTKVPRFEAGQFDQAVMVEEGTTNLCLKDSETSSLVGFGSDGIGTTIEYSTEQAFFGVNSIKWTYGTSGSMNIYLNGTSYFTQTAGTAFTSSFKVKRSDGGVVSGLFGNLYVTNNSNVNGACTITPLENGWYNVSYTRTGLTSGTISLIGLYGFDSAYSYYIDGWQVEAKAYPTSYIYGTRSSETLTIPTAGVLSNTGPWTIECRCKTDHAGYTHRMPFAAWNKFYVSLRQDDRPLLSWIDASGVQQSTAAASAINNPTDWHNWVFTWDGVTAEIYIDAVKVIDVATDLPKPLPANLDVGWGIGGYQWDGLIDNFRISNCVRTGTEITDAYNSGQPLQRDQYTTCLMTFDSTLRDKTTYFTVLDNSPSAGYISWTDADIRYKKVDYNIADGNTNLTYAWWDYDNPYIMQTSATQPTLAADEDVLLFFNKNGIHLTVPTTTVVDGSLIVPESILTNALAANSVTTTQLAAGAVTADTIAANAVGASAIAAGAITADELAAGAVTTPKLAAGAVTADTIAANAVGAAAIAAGAVTADEIASGAITTVKLAAGAVTANEIAAKSIDTTHIAAVGLEASVIKTGTMQFDRISGGTATLGGAGNGNGVLSIKDASGTERVRGDNTGITVKQANFMIEDDTNQVLTLVDFPNNMVFDHSFELIPRTGSADADQTFATPSQIDQYFIWGTTASPRVLSILNTDSWQLALFDNQAICVNSTNYVKQICLLDYKAGLTGPYTLSAWTAVYKTLTANPTAVIRIEAINDAETLLQAYEATLTLDYTQLYNWKRFSITAQNLPTGTTMIKVVVRTTNADWVAFDGIQLVPRAKPVLYNPESSLFRFMQGLKGYIMQSIDVNGPINTEGVVTINNGGASLRLKPGTSDHVYQEFYADSQNPTTRSGWIGFGTAGNSQMDITNNMTGTILRLTNNNTLQFYNGTTWTTIAS
jgi:hypothetical protein